MQSLIGRAAARCALRAGGGTTCPAAGVSLRTGAAVAVVRQSLALLPSCTSLDHCGRLSLGSRRGYRIKRGGGDKAQPRQWASVATRARRRARREQRAAEREAQGEAGVDMKHETAETMFEIGQGRLADLSPRERRALNPRLGPAPEGYSWVWTEHNGFGFLVPDGFHASYADGKTMRMVTRHYCVSEQPPGPPPGPATCLQATIFSGVFSDTLHPRSPVELSQALVALHMRRHGPSGVPTEHTPAPNVIDTWGGKVDEDSQIYGIEYTWNHSDYDGSAPDASEVEAAHDPQSLIAQQFPSGTVDAKTGKWVPDRPGVKVAPHDSVHRWGMHFLVTVITNTKADKAWQIVFQAPELLWEDEWQRWGSCLIDHAVVDWRP